MTRSDRINNDLLREKAKKEYEKMIEYQKFNLDRDFLGYFSNDYWLLLLLVIIENYTNKKTDIAFSSVFVGPYYKDVVTDDWSDLHDYESIQKYIYEYIVNHIICSGLGIASIEKLGVDRCRIAGFVSLVVEYAMQIKKIFNPELHSPEFYVYILTVYGEVENVMREGKNDDEKYLISKDQNSRFELLDNLIDVASLMPDSIFLRLKWNSKKIDVVEKKINQLIGCFSNDEILNMQDGNFLSQINYFYDYLGGLKILNNVVDIPLDSMLERGFEVVKMLKYLEINNMISVEKWDSSGFWKVTFLIDYRDVNNFIVRNDYSDTKYSENILHFADKDIDFSSKPKQRDLLAVLSYEKSDDDWLGISFEEILLKQGEDSPEGKMIRNVYFTCRDINDSIAKETTIKDFLDYENKKHHVKIRNKYL